MDIDPQHNFTEKQLEEFRGAFNDFDRNGDGKICRRELADVLEQLGKDPTEEELKDIINDSDIDGNETLDFDEFLLMMTRIANDADYHQEELLEAFQAFDLNKDGFICEQELKEVMARMGENLSAAEIEKMIVEADKNKDGRVCYEEFLAMMAAPEDAP